MKRLRRVWWTCRQIWSMLWACKHPEDQQTWATKAIEGKRFKGLICLKCLTFRPWVTRTPSETRKASAYLAAIGGPGVTTPVRRGTRQKGSRAVRIPGLDSGSGPTDAASAGDTMSLVMTNGGVSEGAPHA